MPLASKKGDNLLISLLFLTFPYYFLMLQKKIIYWNCHGVLNNCTVDHVKHFIHHLNPQIICLVETKFYSNRTLASTTGSPSHGTGLQFQLWESPVESLSFGLALLEQRHLS